MPIFFLLMRLNLLKTAEDDSGGPNLASATKDQKITANLMPQGSWGLSSNSSRRDLI